MIAGETKGEIEDHCWIKRLALKFKHINLFQDSNGQLDDTIIDAALKLLKEQFLNINRLESPLLQSNSKGSVNLQPPIVQIHHDQNRQHWIVSSAKARNLRFFTTEKSVRGHCKAAYCVLRSVVHWTREAPLLCVSYAGTIRRRLWAARHRHCDSDMLQHRSDGAFRQKITAPASGPMLQWFLSECYNEDASIKYKTEK